MTSPVYGWRWAHRIIQASNKHLYGERLAGQPFNISRCRSWFLFWDIASLSVHNFLFNFFCFSENVRVMKARRRARPVKKCRLQSINKNALASLSLWVVVSLLNKGACWQLCKGSGRVWPVTDGVLQSVLASARINISSVRTLQLSCWSRACVNTALFENFRNSSSNWCHKGQLFDNYMIGNHFCCVCRQKMTQQYSQQVSSALQQWETEAQRAEEQEEKLNVSPLRSL